MASTLKVDTITTPDGTGNITTERPLSGSGASLTNLNASNIDSGTVASARLDTGTTANKILQLDGSAKIPAVDGSQLTNLPAGGTRVFLKQIVANNDASIEFIDGTASVVFDNTYKIYEIDVINLDNATAHQSIYGRLYQVSGDRPITGSSYHGAEEYSYTGASGQEYTKSTSLTEMRFGSARYFSGSSSTTQYNHNGQIKIYNPSQTGKFCHVESVFIGHHQDGTFHRVRSYYYAFDTTPDTNMDGIQIYMSSGNITSGIFNLYGIKDS